MAHHEMQIPFVKTDKKLGLSFTTVWTVLAMSDYSTVKLGFAVPRGILEQLYRLVLDLHPQRRVPSGAQRGVLPGDPEKFCASIASFGTPGRQLETDPLFWVHRIRLGIWKAALSRSYLESAEKLPRAPEVHSSPLGLTASAPRYLAMASWVCGHSRGKFSDDALCDELSARLRFDQSAPLPATYINLNAEAGHRCLWLASSWLGDRTKAWDHMCAAGFNFLEGPALPLGRLVQGTSGDRFHRGRGRHTPVWDTVDAV